MKFCHVILYLKGQIKVLEERYSKLLAKLREEDKVIFKQMLEDSVDGGHSVYLQGCRRGKDTIINTLIEQGKLTFKP